VVAVALLVELYLGYPFDLKKTQEEEEEVGGGTDAE
jgi:hypothetical protein